MEKSLRSQQAKQVKKMAESAGKQRHGFSFIEYSSGPLKFKLEKIDFSIENACISQLFHHDKLVSC